MKTFILINAVLEFLAGMTLLFVPEIVPGMEGVDGVGVTYAKLYGAAAIAIAWVAFKTWKALNNQSATIFLETILIFHAGVTLATLMGYNSGAKDFLPVAILHSALMLSSAFFLYKKKKK